MRSYREYDLPALMSYNLITSGRMRTMNMINSENFYLRMRIKPPVYTLYHARVNSPIVLFT